MISVFFSLNGTEKSAVLQDLGFFLLSNFCEERCFGIFHGLEALNFEKL